MLPVPIQGEKHCEPEAWWYLISRMAPGKGKNFSATKRDGISRTGWRVQGKLAGRNGVAIIYPSRNCKPPALYASL